jgi:hypothetical protein
MTGFALGLGLIVVLARRWVRSDARSGAAPVPDVPLSADEERELSKLRAELAIEERG